MQIKSLISLIVIFSLVFTIPVQAMIPTTEPTINPAASDSFLCGIPIVSGFINSCEDGSVSGTQGPPGTGNITITNFFNLSTGGGNFSSISNVTNFFNVYNSEMNQTPNQTAGPPGLTGDPGPQGETGPQGIQGDPGEIPDTDQFYLVNGTRQLTGNMNAGSKQILSLVTSNSDGTSATNKTYVDLANSTLKFYVDTVNATGITDHGALSGLTDDDHERYFDKDCSKAITSTTFVRDVDNSHLGFVGATTSAYGGGFYVFGKNSPDSKKGGVMIRVVNAAGTGLIEMLNIVGVTDTPVTDWKARRLTNIADPSAAQDAATKNYVDTKQKCGATASVADGGTITHGFGTTPTYVLTTGTVANNVIAVTAKGATTFTVAVKLGNTGAAGTTQTIYWCVG